MEASGKANRDIGRSKKVKRNIYKKMSFLQLPFIHSAIKRFSGKVASCLDCTHFVRLWLRYWLQLANNPLFYDFLFTCVFSIFLSHSLFAFSWQIDSTTLGKYWIQDEFSAFCRYTISFSCAHSEKNTHNYSKSIGALEFVFFTFFSSTSSVDSIRRDRIHKEISEMMNSPWKKLFFSLFFITIPICFRFPRLAEALSNCTIVNMISIFIWNSDFFHSFLHRRITFMTHF